jgi:GntR family transcriptional regulator, transcriptional repressor for pyruvate dehydrogenase complex
LPDRPAVTGNEVRRVAEATGKRRKAKEKPEQIADELRSLIVSGELADGDRLGHEPDLVERFNVSRPSLREALRILETEGLISVVRGVQGGIVVHQPDETVTARTAALVLRARDVQLADVYEARRLLESTAAREVAASSRRRRAARELGALVDRQDDVLEDAEAFGLANTAFHDRLVALTGNQTLAIIAEMLNVIVSRAVIAVSQTPGKDSLAVRRRGVRSQRTLVALIAAGDAAGAEQHWRSHMAAVGKVLLGQKATTVVDLVDHY